MTETNRDQELALRSRAAEAYRYERPEAAQRPAMDTSQLWSNPTQEETPVVQTVPKPASLR